MRQVLCVKFSRSVFLSFLCMFSTYELQRTLTPAKYILIDRVFWNEILGIRHVLGQSYFTSCVLYPGFQETFTPAKYFSIDRVFRNETLDATHLAEFHQIEGVVADYNLTLGDLIGVLYEFFKKLGKRDSRLLWFAVYQSCTDWTLQRDWKWCYQWATLKNTTPVFDLRDGSVQRCQSQSNRYVKAF